MAHKKHVPWNAAEKATKAFPNPTCHQGVRTKHRKPLNDSTIVNKEDKKNRCPHINQRMKLNGYDVNGVH